MRARAASVAAAALLGLLAGCAPSHRGDVTTPPGSVAAVEAAIPALDRARTAVAHELDLVLTSAAAVDARDAVGARGDRTAMHSLVQAHPFDPDRVDATVRALASGAQSYADAVDVLDGAASRATLPSAQQSALRQVVVAARAEAQADRALAQVVATYWPRYRALGKLELTWLERARGGWYRDQKESANAYVVLTAQARPKVEAARPRVSAAASARATATTAYAAAVTAFRQAPSTPAG